MSYISFSGHLPSETCPKSIFEALEKIQSLCQKRTYISRFTQKTIFVRKNIDFGQLSDGKYPENEIYNIAKNCRTFMKFSDDFLFFFMFSGSRKSKIVTIEKMSKCWGRNSIFNFLGSENMEKKKNGNRMETSENSRILGDCIHFIFGTFAFRQVSEIDI